MTRPGDEIGFSGEPWPQFRDEIQAFAAILLRENVRSFLEVGSRYGDTFHFIGSRLSAGSRIVAVDLPGAVQARHADSGRKLQSAADDLRAKGQDAHVIIGDSHAADIRRQVEALGPFDAVFIDGDHSRDGVIADWRDYGSMGRIVAFHDVARLEVKYLQGVVALFRSLCAKHPAQMISIENGCRGIGVIWRAEAA